MDTLTKRVKNKLEKKISKTFHTPAKKIVVLGVGNVLLSDEGIGFHVARELEKIDLPSGVEVIEGGTDGFGNINIIIDTDYLIVIDSVKGGGHPARSFGSMWAGLPLLRG